MFVSNVPAFCTFSIHTWKFAHVHFAPFFAWGHVHPCAICIVVAMQTSVFSAWATFSDSYVNLMLRSSFGQRICQIHFMIPAKPERIAHTAQAVQHLLMPNPSRVLNSLGNILFQMAPHLIEQLCPTTQPYVQRSVHIRCNFKPTSTCPTPPHPTQPYVQRSVHIRCNFKPTSTCPTPPHPTQPYVQRSVHIRCNFKPTSTCPTPPHPTQPYVQRSVHIRCNFKPTSTCPTPPHPTQPYVQRSVHIRCNFKPTSTCPTPPHPTPPRPLSTHVGRSKIRYNKPPSPAKVQPSVVEPKLPL